MHEIIMISARYTLRTEIESTQTYVVGGKSWKKFSNEGVNKPSRKSRDSAILLLLKISDLEKRRRGRQMISVGKVPIKRQEISQVSMHHVRQALDVRAQGSSEFRCR